MTESPANLLRIVRLVPLAVAAAIVAWAAIGAAGPAGGLAVGSSLAFAAGLAAWSRPGDGEVSEVVRPIAAGALIAAPGVLIVFFAFSGGGFFPDSVALAALVLALVLTLRCSLADDPLAAVGPRALVPISALGMFAIWVLISGRWSNAEGLALIEGNRALLYLLAFVLFASFAAGAERLAWVVRIVAAAIVIVGVFAFVSRVAPDVLTTGKLAEQARLSYPLTYWNALGVLCAIGLVLCLHLSASTDEHRVTRIVAAAGVPFLGATILLTFSRGAMGVAIIGLVAYAVLGRPRALVPALIAIGPVTALAVKSAWDATLLAGDDPTSAAAVAQGHDVAGTVISCALLALVIRAAFAFLIDPYLARARLPERARLPVVAAGWALFATVVVGAAAAFSVPSAVSDGWHDFTHDKNVGNVVNTRDRLGKTSNQGRLQHWRAAVDGYRTDRIKGTGAGTYPEQWQKYRQTSFNVVDGHSLYAETLGELGLVGLSLIGALVAAMLIGLLPFRRGPDRALYAAVFAVALVWGVHAGIDWDWEMPAVTLPVMMLAALALGRTKRSGDSAPPDDDDATATRGWSRALPVVVGLTALVVAILPALVLASETRINQAMDAFLSNDCAGAVHDARRSIDVLGARSLPWEIAGLCEARDGRYDAALVQLVEASKRDPGNSRLHGWVAGGQFAVGRDGRAELALARRLNERDSALAKLEKSVARAKRSRWPAVGRRFLRLQGIPQYR